MPTRPVVMVVEDDTEMNELERELLGLHGMETVAAHTGSEAVELCCSRTFDAILLDIMLPEMDGLETCRQLRLQKGQELPIIILTALDGEEVRRQGYEAGADAYFTKPFDPDEIVQTLRKLMHGDNGSRRFES